MTAQEIANVVGRDERSVRRWAQEVAKQNPGMFAQITKSNGRLLHSQGYSFEMACAIVSYGINPEYVEMLKTSAGPRNVVAIPASPPVVRKVASDSQMVAAVRDLCQMAVISKTEARALIGLPPFPPLDTPAPNAVD